MTSKSLNLNLPSFALPGSNYGYTGLRIDELTSFENTICTGLLDESGSTNSFARQMELCVKEIVKSLRMSPRGDNLIYRHCHFGTNFREVHGFLPLSQLNEDMYDGCYQNGGTTALYDSCDNVIRATQDYAAKQAALRYTCNGIIFIITDGQDLGSTLRESDVKKSLEQAIQSETLESLMTILIGVNDDARIQQSLQSFSQNCNFTQYVKISDASEKTLAKLANFISKSVQAQSQHLGSGGPSQPLTF